MTVKKLIKAALKSGGETIREIEVTVTEWPETLDEAAEKWGADVVMAKGINGNGMVVAYQAFERSLLVTSTEHPRMTDAAIVTAVNAHVLKIGRTRLTTVERAVIALRGLTPDQLAVVNAETADLRWEA